LVEPNQINMLVIISSKKKNVHHYLKKKIGVHHFGSFRLREKRIVKK